MAPILELPVPHRLVGIPFIAGGRGWDGCDCWGLLLLAYREVLGIELPSYDRAGAGDVPRAIVEGAWQEVVPPHLELAGDVC